MVAGLLLGCASPAPPRPPSLHLPEKATGLEAQRVGDDVRLDWVNSAKTTDGEGIRGMMTAVVCRETSSARSKAQSAPLPCVAVQRLPAAPGRSTTVEVLPGPLRAGEAMLLVYRVELLNAAGRSAGNSEAVYVAGGQAPPPAGPLTLTPRRGAVLVRWAPRGSAAAMEVRRTLIATGAGPVAPAGRTGAAPTDEQRKLAGTLKALGVGGLGGGKRTGAGEVVLTNAGSAQESGVRDQGGMMDRTVREADTYVYVAQRVQQVKLGGRELELRGVASPAASLEYHDSFPPTAPAGLVAVPGGGFGAQPEIDLAWEPGEEDNLLGYRVYRRVAGDPAEEFRRLNEEPVATAAFRDGAVEAGREYTYRVTAVDRQHHESAPGSEVHERAPK